MFTTKFKKGEHASIATEFKKGAIPITLKPRRYDGNGYIVLYMPNHPYAAKNKRVKEHRYVIEQHIGRYLLPQEVVHHKNGIKDDNRIENLELLSNNSEHLRAHHAEKHPRQKPENTATQRLCGRCGTIKSLTSENFTTAKNDMYGFAHTCRPCISEYARIKGFNKRCNRKKKY
jgi:HNH endonuclease